MFNLDIAEHNAKARLRRALNESVDRHNASMALTGLQVLEHIVYIHDNYVTHENFHYTDAVVHRVVNHGGRYSMLLVVEDATPFFNAIVTGGAFDFKSTGISVPATHWVCIGIKAMPSSYGRTFKVSLESVYAT